MDQLLVARELARLGARPPLLMQICRIGQDQARALYRRFRGRKPTGGPLPYGGYEKFLRGSRHLHASLFLALAQHCAAYPVRGEDADPGPRETWLFLKAYRMYLGECRLSFPDGERRLEPQQAFSLHRLHRRGEIELRACPRCGALRAVPAEHPWRSPCHHCSTSTALRKLAQRMRRICAS
ncbi:FlhC family transcriptional regulator [Methylococcus capsulatus]|uniref:FlhC family transcriptional regulator n=1 Tax=Methylococcus capsulatus TaxID=414 RepID=UPI001C52B281|nr:FlhC family transcriptional regulator [Methylococcus capsulatus]QXP89493.1 flagellar transcriptional regulator FlhC [Methylococcus capsulatus]